VVEAPKPSGIPNVFGLNEPQHVVSKLYFEIMKLMDSLSVWTKSREFPEPLFIAFNTAVTALAAADRGDQLRLFPPHHLDAACFSVCRVHRPYRSVWSGANGQICFRHRIRPAS
jgi:hypothetical protein